MSRTGDADRILHIASNAAWRAAAASGSYKPAGFEADGFIHCSTASQVIDVANAYFRGQDGLVLLLIDTSRLNAELRSDDVDGRGTLFPHIYGALNVDAVIDVLDLPAGANGEFVLPDGLATA